MIIEPTRDTRKRICAICKKNIRKGEIIVKYESVIDGYKNTRMWFGHIKCLTTKLINSEKYIKEELKKIPKVEIERFDELVK